MTLFLSKPQAIFFDWDNTLVDTWSIIHKAINKTFGHFDMPLWTLEEVKAKAHKSSREVFPHLFAKNAEEAQNVFYGYIKTHHLAELRILEGAYELLSFLKSQHFPVAVISNKKSEILRAEIDYLQWKHLFDAIIGSGDASQDKPSPEPILLALRQIGIISSLNVWFVGDTVVDWQSATASGCQPIALSSVALEEPYLPTFRGCCQLMEKISELVGLPRSRKIL